MKKAGIYTRTGDNGITSLADGTRVSKEHPRVEAYGTLDELNALLGLLAIAMENHAQRPTVENIMNNIFSLSSYLAQENAATCPVTPEAIESIEAIIDELAASLPPAGGFLLPSSHPASAQANLCRTVCRRAERRMATLNSHSPVDLLATAYINRLSDYLFTLSRILNKGEEKKWEKYWK